MNKRRRHITAFVLLALIMTLARQVAAQTFTNLYNFTKTSSPDNRNGDGANPYRSTLTLSGDTLYGTASIGGKWGYGTVFSVKRNGASFTNLHSFLASEGANPKTGLVLSDNTLYGTTTTGGSSGNGTVFAVNTDGTGFTNIHNFTALNAGVNPDGAHPFGSLVLSDGILYGTTPGGGTSSNGTVFKVNTDGTGFTNLHSFTGTSIDTSYMNSDGANPNAGLVLSAAKLYGTTYQGGLRYGTVFAINTDGTGFTNLHSFNNLDGDHPEANLYLFGSTLYGTTYDGGDFRVGNVFAINTDGTGFTNLYSFKNNGSHPLGDLTLLGNTLYGGLDSGGMWSYGAIFAINLDGTGFRNLHSFNWNDGIYPRSGLIVSDNTLYGAAYSGGSNVSFSGTLFSLFIQPQLAITPVEESMILTWPTNYPDFNLQSTTNLVPPVFWTSNSITHVVVDGQNTVTNPITGTQQFFRLSQ